MTEHAQKHRSTHGILLDRTIAFLNPKKEPIQEIEQALQHAKGESTWSHHQVAVPKKSLDLKRHKFEKTIFAIPLPGEAWGTKSYRRGHLHAHDAGPVYLVHKDSSEPGLSHLLHDVPGALKRRLFSKLEPFVKEKTADVVAYQQASQHTCAAATLHAVLKHWGTDIPEKKLAKLIGVQGNGAEVTEITRAAKELGFEAYDKELSWSEVENLTDQGIPIICDIQSYTKPGAGHYVVLAEMAEGVVRIMDPNTKGNWRLLSHKEFNERWWDYTMYPPFDKKVRWGVVIKPRKEKTAMDAVRHAAFVEELTNIQKEANLWQALNTPIAGTPSLGGIAQNIGKAVQNVAGAGGGAHPDFANFQKAYRSSPPAAASSIKQRMMGSPPPMRGRAVG